jgi:hypothetical protein
LIALTTLHILNTRLYTQAWPHGFLWYSSAHKYYGTYSKQSSRRRHKVPWFPLLQYSAHKSYILKTELYTQALSPLLSFDTVQRARKSYILKTELSTQTQSPLLWYSTALTN